MTTFTRPEVWQPALVALVMTIVLTPMVAALARRIGMVAAPKKDRWHSRPTALLGGSAIFLAVVAVTLLWHDTPSDLAKAILPASSLLFFLGLIDDIRSLKPYQKLVVQFMAASIVVYAGLVLPWTSSGLFNSAITVFWLVGITNAVNMLDNMDGLAAGVAAIACICLAINFFSLGQIAEGTVITVLAASLCGFLVYNSQPASIFMGDCGSMFVGFFLASTALLTTTSGLGRTRSFLPVIAVPVLTLVIPIFDTTFVTLIRKLSGRAVSQGGRDHTSHRLVALGLSERRAVWLLYALAAISGYLSTQVRQLALYESAMAILGFTIILTLTGTYLAGVKVYPPNTDVGSHPFVTFLVDMSHKRRIFETILDAGLIVIAYYGAWTLRFGRMEPTDPNCIMMIRTLPIVVGLKTGIFLATGVYRGLWRYTSVHDLVGVAKSTIVASIASTVLILLLFRSFAFAPEIFVLDALLLLMAMTMSRVAFRVARRLLAPPRTAAGKPVVIYGAGDAGELLLREIFNNPELGYHTVALLDDDPKKIGKLIHGLRVYAGESLRDVCERLAVQEVIVSTTRLRPGRQRSVIEECDAIGIPLRQMHIALTPMNAWTADPLADAKLGHSPLDARLPVRAHGSTYVVDATALVGKVKEV